MHVQTFPCTVVRNGGAVASYQSRGVAVEGRVVTHRRGQQNGAHGVFHLQSTNVDVTAGFASTLAMRFSSILKQRYALGTIHHVVP